MNWLCMIQLCMKQPCMKQPCTKRFRANQRRRILGLGLLAVLAWTAGGCELKKEAPPPENQAVKTTEWKLASAFSSTLPLMGKSGVTFTERVEAITQQRIRFQFYDPGTLVPALDIFSAVSQGEVETGWSSAGFWFEKIPAAAFFSGVPFGPDAVEFMAWMYEGGGLKLWRDLYGPYGVYPIPCSVVPPEASGWYRAAVTSPVDLKGRKIRITGLGGQVLQKMGASVLQLAGGDLYPALERGVLDGLEFSNPLIDRKVGFSKIAKFYYFPGWHQQSSMLELIVNLDRWRELSPADQLLFEITCQSQIVRGIASGEAGQGAALNGIRQDGVKIQYWPEEMLQGFRKAYEEVLQEMRAKDEDFRRVHDSYRIFRRGYSEWNKLSRLPRGF